MQLWEPTHPTAWAEALGLVHVPLFGRGDVPEVRGEHAVLLDGVAASFHITASDDPATALSDTNLRWAWSSNVTHSVAVDKARNVLFLRRWDDRDAVRKFALPQRPKGASELLNQMRAAGPPRGADVVLHMLRAFRALRNLSVVDNPLLALQLFNLSLIAAEAVERGLLDRDVVLRTSSTFASLLTDIRKSGVDETLINATGVGMTNGAAELSAPATVFDYFIAPEPQQQYVLVPSLLMRHASGQLYQEAHLVLEREHRQLLFPGFAASTGGVSTRRDVRFTPATLARTLIEEAFQAISIGGTLPPAFTVLDPACGSGVFLLEAIRELISRQYNGSVHLRGFDISPLSVAMARFCLAHAVHDAQGAGFTVTATVDEKNALVDDWGSADVILMNPPFVRWESMDGVDQGAVREILGPVARGRADKAMAFVLRAARTITPAGAVASVLPAALLETTSGEPWRQALTEQSDLLLVGRFEGFGYFRASMVEPAFIVLRRRTIDVSLASDVTVLIARETAEDEALRALRLFRHGDSTPSESDKAWELFEATPTSFAPVSWMPRAHSEQQLLEALVDRNVPRVGDLFDVRQGARTGANDVFVLSRKELRELPRSEQQFFRPAAGNSTIREGRLLENEYVFYPYNSAGLSIKSEDDLAAHLPRYYDQQLKPAKEKLEQRAKLTPTHWWKLTREREWQHVPSPKLVSTYFGDRGSFAYDAEGHFVVVQGHGWIWKRDAVVMVDPADPENSMTVEFHDTTLPWAYLALLNSQLFERLLGTVCPRVQGGQFNLSPRFVTQAYLPDMFDELSVPADVVAELGRVGQRMHGGLPYSAADLEEAVARAFGVPRALAVVRGDRP